MDSSGILGMVGFGLSIIGIIVTAVNHTKIRSNCFGKKLEAKTIITGGQSFDPNNKHFTDQAQMYIDGNFKTIHFYKEDVLAHKVTEYNPGLER